MNKIIVLIVFLFSYVGTGSYRVKPPDQYITRQGQISFFSYTSVENIKAQNNQVLSIVDFNSNEVAISMLMNAFVFEKSLMHTHFNESYIESDLYPKATFEGTLIDFDPTSTAAQTKIIRGAISIHGITKQIDIKAAIKHPDSNTYQFEGAFELTINDFDIKVPPVLAPNIAKTISVEFRFDYKPYEN